MRFPRWLPALCWLALAALPAPAAPQFTVATYNVQNYLDEPSGTRPAKSVEARAVIRQTLRAANADVVALQEMGGSAAFAELRATLKVEGLDYPHWELLHAWDTNIHLALLSRVPIVARRPHTNETFVLYDRRQYVRRGFLEVDLQPAPNYTCTLITAHLKSKLATPEADEEELREEEAKLLRQKVDARLAADPNANLIVLGDFNSTYDTKPVKTLLGRANARVGLVDTRPAELNGDTAPAGRPGGHPPRITWTHWYTKEDSYARIDYLLLSKGMAREWVTNETRIITVPNWGVASDHRPIMATFVAEER